MLLFHAAHHHAKMSRLDDDADTNGIDGVLYGFCYLRCQAFLHLQSTSEGIDEPRYLTEPDDLAFGKISNMNLSEEWKHVMLAKAEHLNVFHNHHLVIGHIKESIANDFVRIFLIAPSEEMQRAVDALRSVFKAIAIG